MLNRTISILGCGWLGLPLGKRLLELGFKINGSTTSESKLNLLAEVNISPFLLQIRDNEISGDLDSFLCSETLLINIPYRQTASDISVYEKLTASVKRSSVDKVIFISSTSVYTNLNRIVSESENISPANSNKLYEIENLINTGESDYKTTILRFAGLFGKNRNPAKFFEPGKILKDSGEKVNLIHLDDCIGIIEAVINQNKWGNIFNCCATTHPAKKDFYTKAARDIGVEPPKFIRTNNISFKIVDNSKVKTELDYHFKYDDLMSINFSRLE